ncbi:MAG: hypothetical protein WAN72_18820 [Candidatus Acidiferrales bacterium]
MLHVINCCEERGRLARLLVPQNPYATKNSKGILKSHYTILPIPHDDELHN